MIRGFVGAVGTAGVIFIVMAALAWLALPFGHPVYAVIIPPLVAVGVVYAALRLRGDRYPSIRENVEAAPAGRPRQGDEGRLGHTSDDPAA